MSEPVRDALAVRLAQLLSQCALGNQHAFSQLYSATASKLFGVALRILRRQDWAEEVLQESYMNIWNHAGDYAAAGKLFDAYGIHFDPKLRDEIVGRVDKLNLPSYTGFVMPKLTAVKGADGAMTGFAFPDVLVRVVDLFAAGRSEEAEDLFDIYLPINRHEQQPGIGLAIRKEVLRRRGAIRSAAARYPSAKLSPYDHDEISALLARIDRRIGAASPRAAQ